MTPWTLVKRSLRFYWRTHLGVGLAAALATAVLVGALVVGDSVRYSLRRMAMARLGRVHLAVIGGDRFFGDGLADRVAADLGAPAAPMLMLRGVADNDARTARANAVALLGVDRRFWQLAPAGRVDQMPRGDEVVLSRRLAEQLGASAGQYVLLRVPKPGGLSGDALLSAPVNVAMPLLVRAIVDDEHFGRFDLQGTQIPPPNAYVPLAWLQKKVGQAGRANVLLVGEGATGPVSVERGNAAIRKNWRLDDAQLEVRELSGPPSIELRTARVFLDPPVAAAAAEISPQALGIFTYFVNEFRSDPNATPYSAITGIGPLGAAADTLIPPRLRALADDQIVINDWLAADLGAKPGQKINLRYYVVSTGRQLQERAASFTVRAVTPMEGLAGDRKLMPDIPGLAKIDTPRKWRFGIPIDFGKLRKKDDRYWEQFRGTPKAFVSLATARRLWGNRFGDLTAVRYPGGDEEAKRISAELRSRIDPATVGLFFQPVRARAMTGSRGSSDFGMLFIGLSFFLCASALLLMGLMFALGAQQRGEQIGTLLALGLPPRRVRRLMLLEGAALAIPGVLAGAAGGLLYTRGVLYALTTVWRGAVNTSSLRFYAEPVTVAIGMAASLAAGLATMWLVLRSLGRKTPRELLGLAQGAGSVEAARLRGTRTSLVCGVVCILAAVVIAASGGGAAGAFFGAGALLLAGGAALARACIAWLGARATARPVTIAGLAARNTARRIGRSLAVVLLLACGCFLVVAVGAFRQSPSSGPQRRSGGTGGFALYGQSSLPVFEDLNSASGRKAFGLDETVMAGARVVPFRVGGGEDASCLNLNRAQQPRLAAVRSGELAGRGAFTFAKILDPPAERKSPWTILDRAEVDGSIPAVGDEATVKWGLGKAIGDTLDYTDERGKAFSVKIVGVIANSILQGSLIVSEDRFVEKFPSSGGYRLFLVDAPAARSAAVAEAMVRGMDNAGLELTPTAARMAMFDEVANTYISIFQLLGGFGLILGTFGMGLVVMRNVLARRGELGILRAVGFRVGALHRMVLWEHWVLLAMGLVCGVSAGILAVGPALMSPGTQVPYLSLGLTLVAVAAGGMLWTHLATRAALRGKLLDALRDE